MISQFESEVNSVRLNKMTWLSHVKKTMKSEAGKKGSMGKKWFSHVLKTAKRSYKKGGADEEPVAADSGAPAVPVAGRRRRASKKTRRVKKH